MRQKTFSSQVFMHRQMPLILANQVSKFGVIECETDCEK